MTDTDRRRALFGGLGLAGSVFAAGATSARAEAPVSTFRLAAPGAVPRDLLGKVAEFVSITDFGATGDHVPGGAVGTDNGRALVQALDASPDVYVPNGAFLFRGWPTLRRVLRGTFHGPGRLYYDDGRRIEPIGSILRLGVCDPNGSHGTATQGGVVIGGEGPGDNGTLLHAQHPSWSVLQPTRAGSAVQFQIYTAAHVGVARRVTGTGEIEAIYGDFQSPDIEAGDVVGLDDRLFRIGRKISERRLALVGLDGRPVTFAIDAPATFRHAFYYAEGTCSCDGRVVRRIEGDNFFHTVVLADQKSITLDGRRHVVGRIVDTDTLELAQATTPFTRARFVLKMLPLSRHVSIFRLQSLIGGSEENFSVAETLDGMVRMWTGVAGRGGYRSIVLATGPDLDGGRNREHFVVSRDGRVGIGRNYAHPDVGFPTAARLHVWREGIQAPRPNGGNDVKLAVFETDHGGAAPRQIHVGSFNNHQAGYVQGFVDRAGTRPGALGLNPYGGSVVVGAGSDTAATHPLEVDGVAAPHRDAAASLGSASHRWSEVHAATGVVSSADAAELVEVGGIPDELLDAFLAVEPRIFRWRAAADDKGDAARRHLGYVAQEIAGALRARGLDPARYGLWCGDAVSGPGGAAATRQGLRYDQLLALVDAAHRRRIARLEARLAALEARR